MYFSRAEASEMSARGRLYSMRFLSTVRADFPFYLELAEQQIIAE
jgi:hypothetical protein